MKRIFVLLALCVMVIGGCTLDREDKENIAKDFNEHAFFVKHYEARKCFIFHQHKNYYGLPFSEVECTPAVEALLINKYEEPREKSCEDKCSKNVSPLQNKKIEQE